MQNVPELVDKLLDVIRYEIDRMRELGEDTTSMEAQLREFRKKQKELLDYIQNNDKTSVKLFLNQLLDFSRSVHRYYTDLKSGKPVEEKLVSEGKKQVEEESKRANEFVSKTYDLIQDEDYLIDKEFGGEKKPAVMDTSVPEADNNTKDLENMINKEKSVVEKLRTAGKDTLDMEFKISQQESMLVSMKEAIIDGDYEKARDIRKRIEEIGREIL